MKKGPPAVLYLHGFASSPNSRKIHELTSRLGDAVTLRALDLNVPSFERLDWEALTGSAVEAARREPPAVIVGSSLGSLVALEVARAGVVAPLVLIAPALGIASLWLQHLPAGDPLTVFNHARGADVAIHRRFFEQVSACDADRLPPSSPVHILMGTEDESVPLERVRETWRSWDEGGALAAGSTYCEIAGGDHGLLEHVGRIAEAILDAAAARG